MDTDLANIEEERQMRVARRRQIHEFEGALRQLPGAVSQRLSGTYENDLCPLTHTIIDGIYSREIFIPKGVAIVGEIHRTGFINFMLRGELALTTAESSEVRFLKAPTYMASEPGIQKVAYALEDTTWVTVHRTDKTDIKEIEQDLIVMTHDELPDDVKERLLICQRQ